MEYKNEQLNDSNTFVSEVIKAFAFVFFCECVIMIVTNAPVFAAFFTIILFSIAPFISMATVLHPFVAFAVLILCGWLIKRKLTGYPRFFSLVALISLWQTYGFVCFNLYAGV